MQEETSAAIFLALTTTNPSTLSPPFFGNTKDKGTVNMIRFKHKGEMKSSLIAVHHLTYTSSSTKGDGRSLDSQIASQWTSENYDGQYRALNVPSHHKTILPSLPKWHIDLKDPPHEIQLALADTRKNNLIYVSHIRICKDVT